VSFFLSRIHITVVRLPVSFMTLRLLTSVDSYFVESPV
jgi:hypothetical protein